MKWPALKIALISVIGLSQILLLSFYLGYKNINVALGSWSENNALTIYLKPDTTDQEKDKLLQFLKSSDPHSESVFVSRNQAAKEFQKSIGSYASGILNDDELIDLVPETIEIFPDKAKSLAEKISFFQFLSNELIQFPEVEESVFGIDWLQKFSIVDRFFKLIGYVSFIVLLLSMGFLSALMVRVLIDDARSEIEVFNLLGATRWSIFKIFLKDLCVTVALSLVLSFAVTYLLFASVKSAVAQNGLGNFVAEKMLFLNFDEGFAFCLMVIVFIFVISLNTMTSSLKNLSQSTYD